MAITDIDTGLAIRQKLQENGTTIAWLAKQLNYDKSNLRKLLLKKHIYNEPLLYEISFVLKTNFFAQYYNETEKFTQN